MLPVATYSHMFATVNLLNLMRFLTLRCDAHAQHEIRVYADALRTLAYEVAPVCMAAWEDKRIEDFLRDDWFAEPRDGLTFTRRVRLVPQSFWLAAAVEA